MSDSFDWNDRYVSGQTPWDSGEPSKEIQRVLHEYSVRPSRMLELGCGTGTNAIYLAQRGFTVTAIDVSPRAIEQAKEKASKAKVAIDFRQADLLNCPDLGRPFPMVFDRGVYHHLRSVDLFGFLTAMSRYVEPVGLYLTLAGNANDQQVMDGPPRVRDAEICSELAPLFHLVQLREFRFDGVVIDGKPTAPLAWSALLRRKRSV